METSQQAQLAREGARKLQALSSSDRAALVHRVADTLQAQSATILEINAQDVADGKVAVAKETLSDALAARLALSRKKIRTLTDGIHAIADMAEPIGKLLRRTQLAARTRCAPPGSAPGCRPRPAKRQRIATEGRHRSTPIEQNAPSHHHRHDGGGHTADHDWPGRDPSSNLGTAVP